ncbi:MAG TPA: hemerythrin domain-containing protein [Candidatus Limnocylindrales bacterium]|jgi:iron-sulfur cluster repair protein YtfE (RIC family)|nr:hemerythrin domain-containing protein [Candidatus Limnocylindrales bacterium]
MTATVGPTEVEERIVEREHLMLRAGIAMLQGTIDDASRLTRPELAERVARTTAWLHREVLPHAAWEEACLYPQADRVTGSPWTTRALRFQHEQIRELAGALERASVVAHEHWTPEITYALVAAMARLDALLSAHLAQEELSVLPLLDDDAAVVRVEASARG